MAVLHQPNLDVSPTNPLVATATVDRQADFEISLQPTMAGKAIDLKVRRLAEMDGTREITAGVVIEMDRRIPPTVGESVISRMMERLASPFFEVGREAVLGLNVPDPLRTALYVTAKDPERNNSHAIFYHVKAGLTGLASDYPTVLKMPQAYEARAVERSAARSADESLRGLAVDSMQDDWARLESEAQFSGWTKRAWAEVFLASFKAIRPVTEGFATTVAHAVFLKELGELDARGGVPSLSTAQQNRLAVVFVDRAQAVEKAFKAQQQPVVQGAGPRAHEA